MNEFLCYIEVKKYIDYYRYQLVLSGIHIAIHKQIQRF